MYVIMKICNINNVIICNDNYVYVMIIIIIIILMKW